MAELTAFFAFFCRDNSRSTCQTVLTLLSMPASQKATLLVQAYTGNTESSQDVKTLVANKPELLGTTPQEKSEVYIAIHFIDREIANFNS
jgi:hypothetical protein